MALATAKLFVEEGPIASFILLATIGSSRSKRVRSPGSQALVPEPCTPYDEYARGHSTDGSHDIRGYECLIFPGDRDGLLGARAPSGWHRSDGGAAGRVACEGRVWMVYETRGLHSNFDLFRFTSHLNRLKVGNYSEDKRNRDIGVSQ
jgi:hypothetical protein